MYSCIAILVLFLVCGCGMLVAADDYVRIQADPVDGAPPLTVIFSADVQSSLGAPNRYVWSLGDGERRIDPSFSYTYHGEGTYRVNLMVQFEDGSFGYADAVRITVGNPTATPAPTFTPRNTPTSTPTPTAIPTPVVTSTPTPSLTPEPPEVTPNEAPTVIPTVAALQAPVLVTNTDPAHPLTVSISSVEGTKPLAVDFAIADAGTMRIRPMAYSWDFGDNTRGEGNKPQHIYANAGTYSPVVTVKFSNDHIEILPLALITVLDGPATVVTPTQAPPEEETPIPTPTITATPTQAPTQTFTPAPTPTVIVPVPAKVDGYSVKIIPDKVRGPTPLHVRFTSETTGGVPLAWKWDFGNGHRNTVQKPAHNYGTPGTYVVQLSVQFRGPVWVEAEPVVITVG